MTRLVTHATIAEFIESIGDDNPLHSDDTFAAATPFGRRIAPGLWTAGLISGVIGVQLPGPGSIYMSQALTFVKPVLFGDTITARVEVAEIVRQRNRLRLKTVCTNQRGEEVLVGEAWVKAPKTHIVYTPHAVQPDTVESPWMLGANFVKMWSGLARDMLANWRAYAQLDSVG
jgi:acyl dehydratase